MQALPLPDIQHDCWHFIVRWHGPVTQALGLLAWLGADQGHAQQGPVRQALPDAQMIQCLLLEALACTQVELATT